MKCMIIKVCGMREAANIREVARLDIDMMGFIFYPGSPRYVTASVPRTAADSNLQRVGVFVNAAIEDVLQMAGAYNLDAVQLHGSETAAYCQMLRKRLDASTSLIKAISVAGAEDVRKYKEYAGVVNLFLFDTRCKTMGGSGEQFDWTVLEQYDGDVPFLLSGGIGPEDVGRVLEFRHPQCVGVDLNSRFELEPGVKDVERLRTFIRKIKQARI